MQQEERIKLLEEMIEKEPNDPFLVYAAALEYEKIGEEQKQLKYFDLLLNKFPDYLPVYYQYAKIYEAKGKIGKAIELLRKGKKIAQDQNDRKTLGEIVESLMLLDEEEMNF